MRPFPRWRAHFAHCNEFIEFYLWKNQNIFSKYFEKIFWKNSKNIFKTIQKIFSKSSKIFSKKFKKKHLKKRNFYVWCWPLTPLLHVRRRGNCRILLKHHSKIHVKIHWKFTASGWIKQRFDKIMLGFLYF